MKSPLCSRTHVALCVCIVVLLCAPRSTLAADDPQRAQPALSPQESLKQIVVDPGLKVELVATSRT